MPSRRLWPRMTPTRRRTFSSPNPVGTRISSRPVRVLSARGGGLLNHHQLRRAAHEPETVGRPRSGQACRERGEDQERDRPSGHRQGEAPGGLLGGVGTRTNPRKRNKGPVEAQGGRQGVHAKYPWHRIKG